MEPQKTQNCQNYPEKEQTWKYNPSRLQTILQSYNNQNSRHWHTHKKDIKNNGTE